MAITYSWLSSYVYNGYEYKRGDAIQVEGYVWSSTDAADNAWTGDYDLKTVYFYGYAQWDDGKGVKDGYHPLTICSSPTASSSSILGYMEMDSIKSGGTPIKFTYSFNANGGSGAPSPMQKTYGSNFVFPESKPSRVGYTFNGWYNSGINNGTVYASAQQVAGLPDNDVTWYASWSANKYVVTYKANGGSGSDQTQEVYYGTSWKSKNALYSKTGHTQTGWNTRADGTGVAYALNSNQTNAQLSNLTLYAIYTPNTYTLTVNPNGGTWEGSTNLQEFNQKFGTTKEIKNPARVGYNFTGWTLGGYGSISGTKYTYGAGTGVLTANWERILLTVTFDASANGGSPNSSKSVSYGDTVGTLPTPKKPYYKFIGWFTKAVGGTQVDAAQVITSNVTYYAQFKLDATVKVGTNGEKKPAIVWIGQNGVWKKHIVWIGKNGTWNKSTGAD